MKLEGLDMPFFGVLEFSLFISYSLSQFLSGSIGDNFNKTMVLSISYSSQALCILCLGLAGAYQMTSHYYYLLWFVLLGFSQSFVFPTLVSIIGSWFSKSHRGSITGSWATCTNVGNIIGVQAAALLL